MGRDGHSRAYHKYFEGYTEVIECGKKDGKQKIRRVYTEDYYIQAGSESKWRLRKLLIVLLYFSAVLSFILGAYRKNALNSSKEMAVLEAIVILLLMGVGILVWNYATAPRKMTIGKYHEISEKLLFHSKLAIGGVVVLVIGALAYVFVNRHDIAVLSVGTTVLWFAVCMAMLLVLFLCGRNVVYERIENPLKDKVIGLKIF